MAPDSARVTLPSWMIGADFEGWLDLLTWIFAIIASDDLQLLELGRAKKGIRIPGVILQFVRHSELFAKPHDAL